MQSGTSYPPRLARGLAVIAIAMLIAAPTNGDVVYQTDFDSLTPGQTEPYPGAAGQDGWYRMLAEGDALGEIQDAIADGGQSLHLHTAETVPPGLQTISSRETGIVPLSNVGIISLSVDFYASSSNLGAINNFLSAFSVAGGPHPGFEIIGFGLGAGNGTSKAETGLNVSLGMFDGSTNNDPITLTVGQGLAWDAWHSISISLDQFADTWLSITVDGQTQSLLGYQPVRSFDGTQWLRGQQIETLNAAITPDDLGGIRSDDDVYFDNVILTTQPVPEPSSAILLGLGAAGLIASMRRHHEGRSGRRDRPGRRSARFSTSTNPVRIRSQREFFES